MTALLGPSHIAMVAKGVSAIVASRDAALRPSIMRAVGSHISGDGQEVTVYLRRSQSEQLLQDIAHTGEIAVVFSVPSTHQTLQLKARRATQRPAHDGDLPAGPGEGQVGAHLPRTQRDIGTPHGFARDEGDHRHGGFTVSVDDLGTVTDDATVFLTGTRQEARAVDEGDHRDVVGVADADVPGDLVRGVDVERAGHAQRLVGDDAD